MPTVVTFFYCCAAMQHGQFHVQSLQQLHLTFIRKLNQLLLTPTFPPGIAKALASLLKTKFQSVPEDLRGNSRNLSTRSTILWEALMKEPAYSSFARIEFERCKAFVRKHCRSATHKVQDIKPRIKGTYGFASSLSFQFKLRNFSKSNDFSSGNLSVFKMPVCKYHRHSTLIGCSNTSSSRTLPPGCMAAVAPASAAAKSPSERRHRNKLRILASLIASPAFHTGRYGNHLPGTFDQHHPGSFHLPNRQWRYFLHA